MCSVPAIRLIVQIFNWLKGGFAIYIFAIGCFLASSSDVQQAFGQEYVSFGVGLVFLALLSMAMIYPFKYGVDRHNRFLIVFVFAIETIVFANLIDLGIKIRSYTFPEFSKALQADCLRNVPQIYSVEECTPFYNSDRTAGIRLVWASYFTKRDKKEAFQVLTSIGDGRCCGFFQPFRCIANADKYPKDLNQAGVDGTLLAARVQCSSFPKYYPERDNCKDVEDFSTNPPTIGGCRYDLAAGNCLDVPIEAGTYGCASYMEDWVVAKIAPHSFLLLFCAAINFLYMLLACCMWWKRKEADVFPEFMTKNKVSRALLNPLLAMSDL